MRIFTHLFVMFAWLSVLPMYGQSDYYSANRKSSAPLVIERTAPASTKYSVAGFELQRNYPNPVTGYLELQYEIHKPGHYVISVVGSKGIEVKKLLDEMAQPGNYKLMWPASPHAHGIYMYRLEEGKPTRHKRLLMLKY